VSEGSISFQGFTLKTVDLCVVLLSLLFKVLKLFLKGGVAAGLDDF
jgi:hypothetical protein